MYILKTHRCTHTLYILRVHSRDILAAGSSLFWGPGAKAPAHCSLESLTWGALWWSERSQQPKGEGPQPRDVVLQASGQWVTEPAVRPGTLAPTAGILTLALLTPWGALCTVGCLATSLTSALQCQHHLHPCHDNQCLHLGNPKSPGEYAHPH